MELKNKDTDKKAYMDVNHEDFILIDFLLLQLGTI